MPYFGENYNGEVTGSIFIFVYYRTLAHKILCAIRFRGISGRQSELRPTKNPSNRSGSRANWCYRCNLPLATQSVRTCPFDRLRTGSELVAGLRLFQILLRFSTRKFPTYSCEFSLGGMTIISIRRFFALPSELPFVAIGR